MDLREVEQIAQQELQKHGLHDWTFGWAQTRRRLGVCKFRAKRIEIAEYYAAQNSREKVLDTLMHEIAHALAGPKAGHGPKWKAIAVQLGARPAAYDSEEDTIVLPGDWQSTCDGCGKTYHRYKRPQSLTGYRCRCRKGKPLQFEYVGDPAKMPRVPESARQHRRWEATCHGCQTVHTRLRKPKAGLWRCRCPQRCELVWEFRSTSREET